MIFRLEIGFALKKWTRWFSLVSLLVLVLPLIPARAQQTQPDQPVYVVQEGDTLWEIAQRFHVSLDDLVRANDITDPARIASGDQLIIPGLTGIKGVLTTQPVMYGETLRSLSRRLGVAQQTLARLNHLTSPVELYAGYSLVVPLAEGGIPPAQRAMFSPGETLLEQAVLYGANPWQLALRNNLVGLAQAIPGDILLYASEDEAGPSGLPEVISAVALDPIPLQQGKAASIKVLSPEEINLSGSLVDHPLHFFSLDQETYAALQGIHAMAEPGLYPLELQGQLEDGSQFAFSQMVPVSAVDYPFDTPLVVDPATVDPAVTKPEDEIWSALMEPATPERLWDGVFRLPSPLPVDYCLETNECWSSRFGNRRSYNGSPYQYFHTGLDVVGKVGTEIYAPAPGVVVFAGPLTVRGNATVINHGWGVYTAYMHQSEILVEVGEKVETGQLIGRVGATGRVQGPHLHWEVWAGGVQVDPLDWLQRSYP